MLLINGVEPCMGDLVLAKTRRGLEYGIIIGSNKLYLSNITNVDKIDNKKFETHKIVAETSLYVIKNMNEKEKVVYDYINREFQNYQNEQLISEMTCNSQKRGQYLLCGYSNYLYLGKGKMILRIVNKFEKSTKAFTMDDFVFFCKNNLPKEKKQHLYINLDRKVEIPIEYIDEKVLEQMILYSPVRNYDYCKTSSTLKICKSVGSEHKILFDKFLYWNKDYGYFIGIFLDS